MISTIYCLSLIVYFEGSITSDFTKRLITSVAIERAKQENLSICESMKKPKSYSWMWDGRNTKPNKKTMKSYHNLIKEELARPTITGRKYFNECKSITKGRKYTTKYRVIKSDNLCFY